MFFEFYKKCSLWMNGDEKILNIISVPYSYNDLYYRIIDANLKNDKTILYITGEKEDKVMLIKHLKNQTFFKNYIYYNGENNKDSLERYKVIITSHKNAEQLINYKFSFVIYNDISSMSQYTKYEIADITSHFYRNGSRIICASVEPIFLNCTNLIWPVKDTKTPISEPRLISTRIEIHREIPTVIYDYIKWSLDSNHKLVILTPNEEVTEQVFYYLSIFKKDLHTNISMLNDKVELSNIKSTNDGIIISHHFEDYNFKIPDTDIIIYDAEDKVFNFKKLIFLCSKVESKLSTATGEIIFLSREVTKEMEQTKELIRKFNKEAWEKGYLKF